MYVYVCLSVSLFVSLSRPLPLPPSVYLSVCLSLSTPRLSLSLSECPKAAIRMCLSPMCLTFAFVVLDRFRRRLNTQGVKHKGAEQTRMRTFVAFRFASFPHPHAFCTFCLCTSVLPPREQELLEAQRRQAEAAERQKQERERERKAREEVRACSRRCWCCAIDATLVLGRAEFLQGRTFEVQMLVLHSPTCLPACCPTLVCASACLFASLSVCV